jgi:hypothetical protein
MGQKFLELGDNNAKIPQISEQDIRAKTLEDGPKIFRTWE